MPGAAEPASVGPSPALLMTQDVYMGRQAVDDVASVALEGMFGASTPSHGESRRMLLNAGE